MKLKMSNGYKISLPGASLIILCFFLPWFLFSCGEHEIATASGYDLMVGPEYSDTKLPAPGSLLITSSGEYMEIESDLYADGPVLALVLLTSIISLALGIISTLTGKLTFLDDIGLTIMALIGLLVLAYINYGINTTTFTMKINYQTQHGLWGVMFGYVLIMIGAIFNVIQATAKPEKTLTNPKHSESFSHGYL